MMMRNLILLVAASLLFTSCIDDLQSDFKRKREKSKALKIIKRSSFSLLYNIEDIDIISHDLYILPVVDRYFLDSLDLDFDKEHKAVRFIFKTSKGLYRRYYLINFDDEKIEDSTNDVSEFFEPVARAFWRDSFHRFDLEGDIEMQLMRY